MQDSATCSTRHLRVVCWCREVSTSWDLSELVGLYQNADHAVWAEHSNRSGLRVRVKMVGLSIVVYSSIGRMSRDALQEC